MIEQIDSWILSSNRAMSVDSEELSAIELLSKVTTKTNELTTKVNTLNGDVDYVKGTGLPIEVSRELAEMKANGEFDTLVDTVVLDGVKTRVGRLEEIIVSVKQFGAKGDGATDDLSSIQSAIDYVNTHGGGKVVFPQSTSDYLISNHPILKSNVWIEFTGSNFLKLTQATTTGAMLTNYGNAITNVTIINPRLDGNNILGQNGIGIGGNGSSLAENVHVIGGYIKNCKRSTVVGGGRAVTFQLGTNNCSATDIKAENCTTAIDMHGNTTGVCVNNFFKNITAISCDEIFSAYDLYGTGSNDASIINAIVQGITAKNCGTLGGGLLVFERSSHIKVRDLICYNDNGYATIGGIVRGKCQNVEIDGVKFIGNAEALINGTGATNITPVTTNSGATFSNVNISNLDHIGTTNYVVKADATDAKMMNCKFTRIFVDTITAIFDANSGAKTTCYGEFIQKSTAKLRKGFFNLLNAYADNDFSKTDTEIEMVNKVIGYLSISLSGSGGVIGTNVDKDLVLRRNGVDVAYGTTEGLKLHSSAWNGRHLIMGTFHLWVDSLSKLRIKNGTPTSDTDGNVFTIS